MDNNTDEQKQRHQDRKTASAWLTDAREWAKLSEQLDTENEALPNNEAPHPNRLNVAQACIATAFQLTYNALLVAEAKWPRENDNLEKSHRRLKNDTQNDIQTSIARAGYNDTNRLLKDLGYYLHDYIAPMRQYYLEDGSEQNANRELQISSLFELFEQLIVIAARNLTNLTKTAVPVKLNSEEAVAEVLEKIQEIVRASHDGDYIYRGECQYYGKISSTLYRHYEPHIQSEHFSIKIAQDEMLKEAERFVKKTSDFEFLTQLQHFGGKTNLIDFSTDFLVALFFACDGSHDDDGRIFMLRQTEKSKEKYGITVPRNQVNRVISQKSVFVQPPNGYIVPDRAISIPAYLKTPMLNYLRKHHGISTNSIYNDIHGFVKYQYLHQSAYVEFVAGLQHYSNGDYQEAIRHYNEAECRNPQLPEVYNNRGVVHDKLGSYRSAIKDFDSAIELRPNDATSYSNRGMTYCRKGDFDRGIQDYDEAIKINPLFFDARYNLGKAYYEKEELDKSIPAFTIALTIDPRRADAHNMRGLAYEKAGMLDYAMSDFTKAIELKPSLIEAHHNRGLANFETNNYDSAIIDFTAMIDICPNDVEAYKNRGTAYLRKGNYERAVQDYDVAIALKPDWTETHYYRGLAYQMLDNFDLAIADYTKAIQMNPRYSEALNDRGAAYFQNGDYDLAIDDFNRAIVLNPDDAETFVSRALAFMHLQKWGDAKSDLATAKNLGMNFVEAFHQRYPTISHLEQEIGTAVPEDIVNMLGYTQLPCETSN